MISFRIFFECLARTYVLILLIRLDISFLRQMVAKKVWGNLGFVTFWIEATCIEKNSGYILETWNRSSTASLNAVMQLKDGAADDTMDVASVANEVADVSDSGEEGITVSTSCVDRNRIEVPNLPNRVLMPPSQLPAVDRSKKPHSEVWSNYIIVSERF